jgi:hypothetical protein
VVCTAKKIKATQTGNAAVAGSERAIAERKNIFYKKKKDAILPGMAL